MRRTNIIESSRGEFHSKEIRLSQISLVIVAVFLLCHAIRWIPNIWELRQSDQSDIDWPPWIQNITSLSHLLTVFSSSVNFYIYAYKQCNSPEENEILMDEVEPEFTQRSMMEVANVEVVLESKSQVATSRV
ncbi:uncharacterized protein LOC111698538 [Eurytemora carolleeae]|uniref:uncharacterized protein LOC111698538 n=1 Tax=Eurytemora carolleeae TaxID=1294199 RepID=UPI000C761CE1|nr:uncharacterized protein LOC111698538 [Eurytemora carolleeae]|eukprot:XP_023324659.1 uncharacterized protein LOC111698538 [Eurytemora affinis]